MIVEENRVPLFLIMLWTKLHEKSGSNMARATLALCAQPLAI